MIAIFCGYLTGLGSFPGTLYSDEEDIHGWVVSFLNLSFRVVSRILCLDIHLSRSTVARTLKRGILCPSAEIAIDGQSTIPLALYRVYHMFIPKDDHIRLGRTFHLSPDCSG